MRVAILLVVDLVRRAPVRGHDILDLVGRAIDGSNVDHQRGRLGSACRRLQGSVPYPASRAGFRD